MSPPCSPQIPSLMSGRVLLPSSAAILTSLPTPFWSSLANGSHRDLRLGVTYPEIAEMQTEAVIKAAIEVQKEDNIDVIPEIMIPLTCDSVEYKYVTSLPTPFWSSLANGSLSKILFV